MFDRANLFWHNCFSVLCGVHDISDMGVLDAVATEHSSLEQTVKIGKEASIRNKSKSGKGTHS